MHSHVNPIRVGMVALVLATLYAIVLSTGADYTGTIVYPVFILSHQTVFPLLLVMLVTFVIALVWTLIQLDSLGPEQRCWSYLPYC